MSGHRAPALHRLGCVEWAGVETDACLWGMFMHHIEHFLEQKKVFVDGTHARTDHDTVIAFLLQRSADYGLCHVAKIGKTQFAS